MYLMLVVLTFSLLVGCASIITGTSDQVAFNSNPAGAKVTIHPGNVTGVTPFSSKLSKGKEYTCTAEKVGHQTQTLSIGKTFNGWFVGNLLIGGIIGGIIDIATGAWFNLDRDSVNFHLSNKETGP